MRGILYPIGLVIALCIGYMIGNHNADKHYQAACAWSDLCRMAYDHLYWDGYTKGDLEDLYGDYTSDLEDFGYSITEEDLKEYYWCYCHESL